MALSAAPAARAADEKAYTLDYRAEDGCPSREAIVEQLGSRSRRLVETRRGGIPVSISLTHAGTRYEGRSRVALPDGVRVRSMDGATCEEVADALKKQGHWKDDYGENAKKAGDEKAAEARQGKSVTQ